MAVYECPYTGKDSPISVFWSFDGPKKEALEEVIERHHVDGNENGWIRYVIYRENHNSWVDGLMITAYALPRGWMQKSLGGGMNVDVCIDDPRDVIDTLENHDATIVGCIQMKESVDVVENRLKMKDPLPTALKYVQSARESPNDYYRDLVNRVGSLTWSCARGIWLSGPEGSGKTEWAKYALTSPMNVFVKTGDNWDQYNYEPIIIIDDITRENILEYEGDLRMLGDWPGRSVATKWGAVYQRHILVIAISRLTLEEAVDVLKESTDSESGKDSKEGLLWRYQGIEFDERLRLDRSSYPLPTYPLGIIYKELLRVITALGSKLRADHTPKFKFDTMPMSIRSFPCIGVDETLTW